MDDAGEWIWGGLLAFAVTASAYSGCETGHHREKERWHQEMIERGHAEYNRETGQWQWIDKESEDTDG